MQRRAAAVSAVVLLLIAAGAYAVIGSAAEPEIDLEADETISDNETREFGGQTYNFSVDGEAQQAAVEYTNESYVWTESLENNSTTEFQGDDYRVLVPAVEEPSEFTFREVFNVSAILADDPAIENETITRADDQRYVVYVENGTTRPLDEYLPDPRSVTYAEGDTFDYRNNSTTVANVSNESVTLQWTAPRTTQTDVSEGANITLAGSVYVAHFPGGNQLALGSYNEYVDQQQRVSYFHERISGLWGVVIVCSLAAVVLLMMAYLPSRY